MAPLALLCVMGSLTLIYVPAESTNTLRQEVATLKSQMQDLQRTVRRQDRVHEQMLEMIRQQNQVIGSLTENINTKTKTEGMETGIGFSAYSSTNQNCEPGTILQFDMELTDIGDFYNNDNSVFICPQDGIYQFSLSVDSIDGQSIHASLIKDGTQMLSALHGYVEYGQGSNTLITECSAFESVWVECLGVGQLNEGREASFSGVLITSYA